jgi:hypothetical protein
MHIKRKNNKPLIYTIATNDSIAFSCSLLLFKSLNRFLKDDFDFQIIVPESDTYLCPIELKPYIFPIYNYHYKNQHIFTLKYHHKIFSQSYNYFIYMDSDILWMINLLFNLNYNCICLENGKMQDKAFSRFWPQTVDKSQLYKLKGINAGFFGLKKDIALELSNFMMKNLYTKTKIKKLLFEQNMFNWFVYNFLQKNTSDWININSKFILGAEFNSAYIPEMAYHFYGNMGNMYNKLERMQKFLENNHIIL